MAVENKKTIAEIPAATEEVVVSDVPVAEKPKTTVVEKEAAEQPEAEEPAAEAEKEKDEACEEEKVAESASLKEESNKVDDLIDPEKKALDEFKQLIQEALSNHEFTAAAKEEEGEKKTAEVVMEEAVTQEEKEEPKTEEETKTAEVVMAAEPSDTAVVEKVEAAEEIKVTSPEEVSIWGVPLLCDERSDVILLKFLRARDFKVKEAFSMLKKVVAWRKEFKIDELLEEEGMGEKLEKVVYIHGVDKEGHPVAYNAFGEFQDKELYSNTFSDAEKRAKFLRWYIQFLEKNIRKLDFRPDGVSTIVQVTDLKNSPGFILFKKELRQATNQALHLLQDNYPEFVAKQVFINVPWWYLAYNRMISPFLTQRTKSKFEFAGPTKTAETLVKYIAGEQVPVQYGGLSKGGEHEEFTTCDAATEETIKPSSHHTIEMAASEAGTTLVWEVRVVGWEVSYGAEFVPTAEGGYTWIVQKPRKIGASSEEQVLTCSFKMGEPGKVLLTFHNQTSKKKKLLFRSKINSSQ